MLVFCRRVLHLSSLKGPQHQLSQDHLMIQDVLLRLGYEFNFLPYIYFCLNDIDDSISVDRWRRKFWQAGLLLPLHTLTLHCSVVSSRYQVVYINFQMMINNSTRFELKSWADPSIFWDSLPVNNNEISKVPEKTLAYSMFWKLKLVLACTWCSQPGPRAYSKPSDEVKLLIW